MKRIFILLIQIILLSGCSGLVPNGEPTPDTGIQTQVAVLVEKTLGAEPNNQSQQTQMFETVVAAVTLTAPVSTSTNLPSPTNSLAPTPLALTVTTTPASSSTPTATSKPLLCNHAQFVKDMTVPDGALFPASSQFTKIWRIKNIGTCTWTKEYKLGFDGGDKLGGSVEKLPKKVAPGEVVDIAISFEAPAGKGAYKGYWILKDAAGNPFGIGERGKSPVWVQIKVANEVPRFSYDFAANFSAAVWKTDQAILYPHGTGYSNYVQYTTNFQMETDKWEDEPAIIVNVESGERVRGKYPSYLVQPGDRFVAQIGCVYGSKDCKVNVTLIFQIKGTDTVGILGEWSEKYDGSTTMINVDLSSLAGKEVIFILDVEAKSQSKINQVFWFVPTIRNP